MKLTQTVGDSTITVEGTEQEVAFWYEKHIHSQVTPKVVCETDESTKPLIKPSNEWIDVNTELPETGVEGVYCSAWVLASYVFDGKQYVGEVMFVKVKQPYWKNVHGDKMINNQVTHWMPMPEIPKLKG